MAASNSPHSRNPNSLSTPLQISKDVEGQDNPIPLSPQWLLPKPGENKTGMMQGDNNAFPGAGFSDCSDVMKSPGRGEEIRESQKKEDMFKLTFMDTESARSDLWRDEERDTNPVIRRDRMRESDKETGDTHRSERWVGNSSMRTFGEARQGSSDRRTDSNRDTNYDQRRESKWNTRWGPDNREGGKWGDVGKHSEMSHEKGPSVGKNEKEGDHFRPWRPSSLQGRGRAEPPHNQTTQMGKKGPTYGHGRGHGETTPPTFSIGRGRSNFGGGSGNNYSSHSKPLGTLTNRGDNSFGEPSPSRYSRTKLLDIYRTTDLRSPNKILDGLLQVSSLTHEEPLEPLALCAPSAEESAVLKGIDKGDIIGSGASQITKDGSAPRNSVDNPSSRLPKHGSKEDISFSVDDPNDKDGYSKGTHSKFMDGSRHERQDYAYASDAGAKNMENHRMHAESKSSADATRNDISSLKNFDDPSSKGKFRSQSGPRWHSPTVNEHARSPSHDWSDEPRDIHSDPSRERDNGLHDQTYAYNERKWRADEEHEARSMMQSSPENLSLYYKDPQGQVQGPFAGIDIIGWFEAGYFGIDLQVRLANAPHDSPFSLLGDVMPHLRAKARPPPGFNTTKQNEATEFPSRSTLGGYGMVLPPGSSGIDLIGDDYRHARTSSTSSVEAQKRFMESLMSGGVNNTPPQDRFSFTEGLQGFSGHPVSSMPPVRAESGDPLNLMAARMNLEQHKSLPHPYPYWPARDAATTPVVPTSDILRDSSIRQPDIRQTHLPSVEMSVLQGLPDMSPTGMKNGAGGGWPGFSVQGGGLDLLKDKVEPPHAQNTQAPYGVGIQQLQIQPPPNQPSVPTVHPQSLGNVPDAQLLTLMQQQQYMMQLQSQQSMLTPQLSLMDRILLLNQQHKQEEQQQLLRHQQQLLQQLHLSSNPVVNNAPIDLSELNLSRPLFQSGLQVPGSVIPNDQNSNLANMPSDVSQDLNHTIGMERPALHLPHHLFEAQKSQSLMGTNKENVVHVDSSLGAAMIEKSPASKAVERSETDSTSKNITSSEFIAPLSTGQESRNDSSTLEGSLVSVDEISTDSRDLVEPSVCRLPKSSIKDDDKPLTPGIKADVKVESSDALQETAVKAAVKGSSSEVRSAIEVKNVEAQAREVKKASDKKSRKSKSSKASKSGFEGINNDSNSQLPTIASGDVYVQEIRDVNQEKMKTPSTNLHDNDLGSELKGDQKKNDSNAQQVQGVNSSVHRAWKPSVCAKPKSLLEIQQEEQQRLQMETSASVVPVSVISASSPTPWSGVVTYSEPKLAGEIALGGSNSESNSKPKQNKSKSELHDLLAQEVLAKSNEKNIEVSHVTTGGLDSWSSIPSQTETVDDGSFIEAKDTKKSRKKAAKAKNAAAKASLPISADVTVASSSPSVKGKTGKHVQTEEVLPAPPSGPSLGDFVPWKGEPVSPSPAPAWSTDSVKLSGRTSLRDILKEQEKRVSSTPQHSQVSSQKAQASQTRPASSWSVSASPPSKAALPVQVNSHASSQSNHKGEDDLFWGSPDQTKLHAKQVDYPQLGNRGSKTTKNTPSKGVTPPTIGKQKSIGANAQSSAKGKRNGNNKHSEAVDFRDWCESESVRLTGSKDTSFLEFCLKQSRSEAEMLLIENLGSFDPNHEFIEKFLNYMELLPADVIEIAFRGHNDTKTMSTRVIDTTPNDVGFGDIQQDQGAGPDGSAKASKKKGKKGKKVSPSVLGFNVVSNRIMMGEIQTVED